MKALNELGSLAATDRDMGQSLCLPALFGGRGAALTFVLSGQRASGLSVRRRPATATGRVSRLLGWRRMHDEQVLT